MYNYEDKVFATRSELQAYVRENKSDLAQFKRASIKHADSFGTHSMGHLAEGNKSAPIEKLITSTDRDTETEIFRTIIGNTYYYMDSHRDVHVKGCFTKSISQREAKRFAHLHDHKYSLEAKVGTFENIVESELSWRELGVDIDGTTWALVADSRIQRSLNQNIFNQYKSGEIDQHSVGMYYVRMDLAIDDPDDEEHYKHWVELIDRIANREEAEKIGYFWVVREAKLVEISAVIAGSNPITPTISVSKAAEPPHETKTEEPPAGTLNKTSKSNYYSLIHNY